MSGLDIHTLMFTAEAEFDNVLRQALREYMEKHSRKAKEPDSQARVLIQASIRIAREVTPNARDILRETGKGKTKGPETPTDQATEPPVSIKRVTPGITPAPVQIIKVQE